MITIWVVHRSLSARPAEIASGIVITSSTGAMTMPPHTSNDVWPIMYTSATR